MAVPVLQFRQILTWGGAPLEHRPFIIGWAHPVLEKTLVEVGPTRRKN